MHVCFCQAIFNTIEVLKILYSDINSLILFCKIEIESKIQFSIFDHRKKKWLLIVAFNFQYLTELNKKNKLRLLSPSQFSVYAEEILSLILCIS